MSALVEPEGEEIQSPVPEDRGAQAVTCPTSICRTEITGNSSCGRFCHIYLM